MECLVDSFYLKFILTLLCSILSLILSILVILIILKKDLFRVHSYKILTYISINDLIRSFISTTEFFVPPDSIICSLYGFLDYYFFAANPIWALCLTFTIFQIIVLEQSNFEKFHKFWIFFNVFIVGGIQALPFITENYGYSEGFCQMVNNKAGIIWRFSLLYIPLSIILVINIVLFIKIMKKVKEIGILSVKVVVMDRGMIYTLIILIVFVPFMILRVAELIFQGCAVENVIFFLVIFYYLQGFLNGVAFFYNKTIRSVVFKKKNTFLNTMQTDIQSLRISYASEVIN